MKEEIRLNKYITEAGTCSRREADRLIESGKVYVDGQRAVLGMKIEKVRKYRLEKNVISGKEERLSWQFISRIGIV